MEIGICTSPDSVAGISDPAFDFVEANVQAFLKPERSEAEFATSLDLVTPLSRPVPAANCFLPGDLRVTGPSVDFERLERYAGTAFERAARVGVGVIVFGSGGARNLPEGVSVEEGFARFAAANRRIAPLAERHGVVVVIEPLNRSECNFINSLADGARAVEMADHPNIRLLVDFYHMLREDESPGEIRRHGALIHHVHLAEKAGRTAPGVKGDDFRPFLAALKATGYQRLISIESNWGDLVSEQAAAVAVVRKQLAEV